ncbi:MAG: 3-hydroxyacyl-CoA dehydrogenase family protein, partial [Anaerovoracaceae bacterium]
MKIQNIVIAGAGTMGYSIAEIFSQYDFEVTLYDISMEVIQKAESYIELNRKTLNIKSEEKNKIYYSNNTECFKVADFVIETIVEDIGIKQEFYRKISKLVGSKTILTTNTSGLSINEIAKAVTKPERFIGMHWFNPSNLVLLIEIIKGDKTANDIADIVEELCLKINKKPVVVNKDIPGFVANRIQFAVLREALSLVEEGIVDEKGVDDIMRYGLGFRYACAGPLQIADFGGLDTFYKISQYLMKDLNAEKEVSALLKELYEEGNYGVKT